MAARRVGMALVLTGGVLVASQPAMAQSKYIERTLAGVKLNSASRMVLAKFGNPNEIYIGDIGVRVPGTGANQGAAGGAGGMGGGMMGGMPGMGGSGGPMMGGMPGMGGSGGPMMGGAMGSSGMGGMMRGPGGMPGGMTGPGSMMGSGSGGPMMGSSGMGGRGPGGKPMMGGGGLAGSGGGKMGAMGGGGNNGDEGGMLGSPGGMPGGMMGGMPGGMMGGGAAAGGGIGAFGQTQSRVARQQEVTWVFNRLVKDSKGQNSAISYEFLINPSGGVSQIRCLGYQSPRSATVNTPSIVTERGIRLSSSYADVLKAYGQPETYEKVGNVLVLSYPKRHVQFQLINQQEQASPVKAAYKVIAITIATIEG